MIDPTLDNAIAAHKTYGDLARQHAVFTRLRQEDPVHWTEPEGFRPFWTVTKLADVLEVERASELFINAPRSKLFSIAFQNNISEVMQGRTHLVRGLPQMDGADHRAYRGITQAWFQPKQVKRLEAGVAALAKRTVDDLLAAGPECDFYRDIVAWYPLRVILMILGLPDSDAPELLRITQAYFGGSDPDMQKGSDLVHATQEYVNFFDQVAKERRAHPTDDVASIIASATLDGQPIGHYETYSYYIALASAGHDTTSATAAGGLLELIRHPEQWRRLKAEPALIPSAMEEFVRWVSPVKHFFRTATADYSLRGRNILAGQSLMLSYPSANRDEEVFADPFEFRIDRNPNRHVGFGYGPHICIGMFLAKMELQLLLKELLARVDHFELDGEPAWVETSFVGGLKRLPVRVTAAG